MDYRLQIQPHPSSPSPTDDKANYDDLFDEYTADYNKNADHQTFTIQSPTLAHASNPQHRRGPSFPLNNQSQSSISHKPIWDYPPSSPAPTSGQKPSRPFWQKVLFHSPQSPHNNTNQASNTDPPRLAVLSALCTDRGHSDHCRPGD